MLVLGAKGHAIEVLDVLLEKYEESEIVFFDDTNERTEHFLGNFIVSKEFPKGANQEFCLGVGGVNVRKLLSSKALMKNLIWKGIRSENAVIGKNASFIHSTVDLMLNVTVSSAVSIGKGTLVNRNVSIHHEVEIGAFCELAPHCCLLGKVKIANDVFVGAGAIVLPGVKVGEGAVIGAGAIVVKDVAVRAVVVGNPSRLI
jgi:sugar O-acyltransferase (sialic acid O-acetyltransferase NeuD family)